MDNDEFLKQYEFIFSNEDVINIDLNDITSNTITVSTIGGTDNAGLVMTGDGWQWTTQHNVVFQDIMPSLSTLNSMCKEYPALEKAYENFKTVYKMVEQDWNGKQKDSNA